MSRPLVRTEVVDEGLASLMKQVFGRSTQAYQNLSPMLSERGVTWYVFQRAFSAKPVEKKVCRAIQEAMDQFGEMLWETTKERRKARQQQ